MLYLCNIPLDRNYKDVIKHSRLSIPKLIKARNMPGIIYQSLLILRRHSLSDSFSVKERFYLKCRPLRGYARIP